MVLASLSDTAWGLVIGGYLFLALVVWLIFRRDVNGRTRANGCILGIVLFFGLFVAAFASWASDAIF